MSFDIETHNEKDRNINKYFNTIKLKHKGCGGEMRIDGNDGLSGEPVYKCQKCNKSFWRFGDNKEFEKDGE